MRPLATGLLLFVGCGPASNDELASDVLPNVLLVSIDTLRADHLASYGYEWNTAPTLTELAGRGAQFEQSFSQSSTTTPSHASMFTGLSPSQHGFFVYWHSLRDEELTLAEYLRQHGYETFATASSRKFVPESGFGQGFEVYEPVYDLPKNERGARVTDIVLENARRVRTAPWFGFAHFFEPHAPYDHPDPFQTRWHPGHDEVAPEETTNYLLENSPAYVEVSAPILTYLRGAYDGGISFTDFHLRRLIDGLPDNGRPTLLVVTSDHGEEFKEHGHLGHSMYLHEELVRVPLIVVYPGIVPAGQRIAEPVQNADLFPTIVELAGLPLPDGLTGRSFADRLRGGDRALEQRYPGFRDVVVLQRNRLNWAVVATLETGRFKLERNRGRPEFRLFRLDDDPNADEDMLALYPDERQRLMELADTVGVTSPRVVPERRKVTDEEVEELRAMGYAGKSDDE